MKTLFLFFCASVAIAGPQKAPPGTTEFNIKCQATPLCARAERAYTACNEKKESECDTFVRVLRQLLPTSDCKRLSDSRDTVVPGLWLCDAHADFTIEKYLERLSTLRTPEARELFASEKLRQALEGAPAGENFIEESRMAEEQLKNKNDKIKTPKTPSVSPSPIGASK